MMLVRNAMCVRVCAGAGQQLGMFSHVECQPRPPAVTGAVDCFKCSSRNGSNPACEDPFHNLNTTRITSPILPDPQPNVIYHTPCYAGKKGRDGLFPASACIKLTGVFGKYAAHAGACRVFAISSSSSSL
ncbi:Hypothetical predicted protein [Olea europaea subsp. europaea]|uniref:Uncharacterized protein n=1 Tax=Olea europaea subsp. europaea TaxID=158383 RepID=A0A8S0QDX1_OLEEU|nr:Hypothetical predicted protein [Olea europaea subsp. europaea]